MLPGYTELILTRYAMSKLKDKNSRLLDVLLEVGKITSEDVEKIVQLRDKTREKADRILLNLGIISEEDLRDALGNIFNLKIWEKKKEEDLPVVDCLPQSFLHSNRILPIRQYDGYLDIAITDPSDESLLEVIESTTNRRVNIFVGCEKDIITSIDETYEDDTEEEQSAFSIDHDVVDDIEKLKDLALEAPVVRLVNNFSIKRWRLVRATYILRCLRISQSSGLELMVSSSTIHHLLVTSILRLSTGSR